MVVICAFCTSAACCCNLTSEGFSCNAFSKAFATRSFIWAAAALVKVTTRSWKCYFKGKYRGESVSIKEPEQL